MARLQFRADSLYAARAYVTAMGGRATPAALVAAETMCRADMLVVAYIEAMGKAGKRGR